MRLSEQVSDAPNTLPYPRRLGQSADGGQSCPVRICYVSVYADPMQAEEIDLELRTLSAEPPLQFQGGEPTWSFPLSSWAYHQKLVQFRLILQMGFELSIYSPEELPGMYWYLSHICSTHLGHIDRIRTFTVAARKRDLMSTGDRSGNSSQKVSAFHRSFHALERLTTHIIAVDAFAIALHALYVVLARHKVLPSASSPQAYSTDRLRYEIRMNRLSPSHCRSWSHTMNTSARQVSKVIPTPPF
jgi:hypothetical protein